MNCVHLSFSLIEQNLQPRVGGPGQRQFILPWPLQLVRTPCSYISSKGLEVRNTGLDVCRPRVSCVCSCYPPTPFPWTAAVTCTILAFTHNPIPFYSGTNGQLRCLGSEPDLPKENSISVTPLLQRKCRVLVKIYLACNHWFFLYNI